MKFTLEYKDFWAVRKDESKPKKCSKSWMISFMDSWNENHAHCGMGTVIVSIEW